MRFHELMLLLAGCAACQTTVYGTGGLNFVPGGLSRPGGDWGGSIGATTEKSPLQEASLNGRFLDDRLEVTLSNLYHLVESDSGGWNPGRLGPIPFIPSARWILDREDRGRQTWGYSAGFSMPYGAFAAAGWTAHLPWISPEIDLGLGTQLRTVSAFGGAALDICDGDGRILPLRLTADASASGATETLGSSDEAFFSVGVSTRLGRNLTFQVLHRWDRHYTAPVENNREGGVSFLRLLWTIDAQSSRTGDRP